MSSPASARLTVWCCYVGMLVQAAVTNLVPLVFVPLKDDFGLTFEQLGRLVLINFTTQLIVDLLCVGLVDRVNVKPFVVVANALAALGLVFFALAPNWMATPYHGLVLGTIVFSAGCGFLEVLLSPIVDAVRTDRKAAEMALLHAFYPIGKVATIVITVAAFALVGVASWRTVMLCWTVLPIANTIAFLLAPLPRLHGHAGRESQRTLLRRPAYWGLLAAMVLAGATEVTIAQWTSAFAERGLGFSKTTGDLVGFCLFGVGMIVGRLWFGLRGETAHLHRVLIAGAATSVGLYLAASLSPVPMLALVACATSGLTVSLLWPGTLSLASARFPLAGTAMFALMAAGGDTGAAVMPWAVGWVADRAGDLHRGLLVATVAPVVMTFVLIYLRRESRRATRTADAKRVQTQ